MRRSLLSGGLVVSRSGEAAFFGSTASADLENALNSVLVGLRRDAASPEA